MDKKLQTGTGKKSRLAPSAPETGMWQWTVASDTLQWSDNLWGLYGITDRSKPVNLALWLDSVCLPDRERVFRTAQKAVKAEKSFEIEWRVRQAEELPPRWLQTRGVPLRDSSGVLTHYIGTVFDITGHRQTIHERDLWASTFRLTALPLAIFSIHTTALIAVNNAFAERLGHTPDKLRGKALTGIFPRTEWKKLSGFICKVGQKGYGTFDTSYRCKDGTIFYGRAKAGALDNGTGIYDRALICLSDTTRQKEAEARYLFANLIFSENSDGILLSDGTGKILIANREFERLCGIAEGAWQGKKLSEYLSMPQSGSDTPPASSDPKNVWRGTAWLHTNTGNIIQVMVSSHYTEGDLKTAYYSIINITDARNNYHTEANMHVQSDDRSLDVLQDRHLFQKRLEEEVLLCRHNHYTSALLFIELDRLDTINIQQGHAVGDRLLTETTGRIRTALHDANALIGPQGAGFTIILKKIGIRSTIERIAQSILHSLSQPFRIDNREFFISASIGITTFPADVREADSILKCARLAMQDARSKERDRYSFFTHQMQEAADRHTRLGHDIRHALTQGQLEVQYQPIVNLATGQTLKAEALLRWTHPEYGPVSPAQFIPIAEETGTINDIGDFVIRQTIDRLQQWRASHTQSLEISINISPSQLREKRQWLHLAQPLAENGLRAHSLILEITEGMLLRDDATVLDNLAHLHRAGMRIALDDFGTGYSSLSYLSKFEIDFLKIDKSFVDHLADRPSDRVLCDAMIAMAHKLGCQVIAEGIENEEQRSLISALGCDYGQGYLFSRALPWPDFLQKIS